MSRHDDRTSLLHMRDSACEAVEMVHGMGRDDIKSNRMLQLAVMRLIEVVGEAAGRISDAYQSGHPEIPWREIINMRNRLIHGYDQVDLDILWDTLQEDLPRLINSINKCLTS
jgi:uncharacterized protein with HEPN domain